ncbi:unnamed protein product [Durusdinium trenchii]|uniref:EF-hand domain-containing protein n=1 Tax=Durusdinium trenchii TaxID=1381693 RepID=A0ABP0MGA6_9DINO
MDSDFVSEYRSLADPGDVTSSKKVEEAQLFKKILKTNTAQFKSDTDKALRRSVQAKKERERLKALRGGKGHTFLYSLTSAHSHRLEAVIFRNFIGILIVTNVVCFIIETDKYTERKFKQFFHQMEAVSSCIFAVEYVMRVLTIHENKRFEEMTIPQARLKFISSFTSVVDLVSFMPWFIERIFSTEMPNLQFLRVIRLFRLFKSNSVMASVDVIARVLYFNREILCVAFMIDLILILLMSTVLYYMAPPPDTPGLEDDFESIPATMYLSVMMLTGQGQPGGQLPWYTKVIVVVTAVLATAQFAIPASMLTWGFEQEAERRLHKNHQAQIKQKERILKGDTQWDVVDVSSSSTSESDVGHEWAEYEAVVVGSDSESEEDNVESAAHMTALSASEAARIAKVFSVLDADDSGMLQTSEICRIVGGHGGQSQIDGRNLSEVLDGDNDGRTSSEEFLQWLTGIKAKNIHVFHMIMKDLEDLKPKRRGLGSQGSDLMPENLMAFAMRFQELNEEVKRLKDEVASKDMEIAWLKH